MQQTDGQLLAEFLNGSEAAFETLAERHGKLVFGVCRRLLRSDSDADDAAQAVFLTLAKKARSLSGRVCIAGWLHQVSWNIARRVREAAAVRTMHEQEARAMTPGQSDASSAWRQVSPVLDQELAALPDKYREALILHHVEGWTQEEAARIAGCNTGTLSARLNRGRTLLRERLARSGVVLSVAVLSTLLSEQAGVSAPAGFSATAAAAAKLAMAGKLAGSALVSSQAVAFSEGALKTMSMQQLKTWAAVVAVILGLSAAGAAFAHTRPAAALPVTVVNPVKTDGDAKPENAGEKEAKAPAPVTKNGLQVTLEPVAGLEQKIRTDSFAKGQPIAFRAVFTNVSNQPLVLHHANYVRFTGVTVSSADGAVRKTFAYTPKPTSAVERPRDVTLDPGKSYVSELTLFTAYEPEDRALKEFEAGQYSLNASITFDKPADAQAGAYWEGTIVCTPVPFAIVSDENLKKKLPQNPK